MAHLTLYLRQKKGPITVVQKLGSTIQGYGFALSSE